MKSFVVLTLILAGTSHAQELPGDIDGDGVVAFSDFLILSENFGKRSHEVSATTSTTTAIREQQGLPERYHGWWGLERADDLLDVLGDVDLVGHSRQDACSSQTPTSTTTFDWVSGTDTTGKACRIPTTHKTVR